MGILYFEIYLNFKILTVCLISNYILNMDFLKCQGILKLTWFGGGGGNALFGGWIPGGGGGLEGGGGGGWEGRLCPGGGGGGARVGSLFVVICAWLTVRSGGGGACPFLIFVSSWTVEFFLNIKYSDTCIILNSSVF